MADLSLLLEFYENLVKSRRFDEMLWDAYVNGKPLGMTHLGIGEEAVGTATMKAFRDTDISLSSSQEPRSYIDERLRYEIHAFRDAA